MEDSKVEVYIENESGKLFMVQCPRQISYEQLKKLVHDKKITEVTYLYFTLNGASYDSEKPKEIMNLEEGNRINIVNERTDEGGIFTEFHKNINLNESDDTTVPLTGILRLILLKHISSNIKDTDQINSSEIKKIVLELKKGVEMKNDPQNDIKTNLTQNEGNNIL